jgi:hypothetical protein
VKNPIRIKRLSIIPKLPDGEEADESLGEPLRGVTGCVVEIPLGGSLLNGSKFFGKRLL